MVHGPTLRTITLTTPIEEGTPYPPPGDVLDSPVGLAVLIVRIRVITKLPNSEQSSKGKVKTHKYINRQNQSTTGKLRKP